MRRRFGSIVTTLPVGFSGLHSRVALTCISHSARRSRASTCFRATLVFVADNQNITLSVPRELLKRVKRVAADRDTSVSALMTEALDRLADEDRRYSAARKRALAALKSARSLGTQGRQTWSRDELHER
jgi:predicted transcriptional regulator